MTEEFEPQFPIRVGKCIYCGSTEDLSDEHIIPEGLNGEWELLDASCKKCRDVTSAIEGRVLGWGLGLLRQKLPFRTRHKKRRTGMLPVIYHVGTERRTIQVPVADHHGAFAIPVLTPPSYLSGGERLDLPGVVAFKAKWHTPSLTRLQASLGADTISVPFVDPIDLARMLAKIGYAFAVACLEGNPGAFEEVYVLPTILDGPNAGHYVGCLPDAPKNNEPAGHQITLVRAPREVTTYIRLFAEMDLPEYTVVVGRLRQSNGSVAA